MISVLVCFGQELQDVLKEVASLFRNEGRTDLWSKIRADTEAA